VVAVEVVGLSDDSDDPYLIPEDPYEMVGSRKKDRMFMRTVYKMQADESKLDLLDSKSPSSVVNMVMRKGMVELGDSCRLVACPCRDNPAACFIVDDPRPDSNRVFCCGCAVEQKEKRKISNLLGKETVFETFNLWNNRCSYRDGMGGRRPTEDQSVQHFVLKTRDDVEVSSDATKMSDFK